VAFLEKMPNVTAMCKIAIKFVIAIFHQKKIVLIVTKAYAYCEM